MRIDYHFAVFRIDIMDVNTASHARTPSRGFIAHPPVNGISRSDKK